MSVYNQMQTAWTLISTYRTSVLIWLYNWPPLPPYHGNKFDKIKNGVIPEWGVWWINTVKPVLSGHLKIIDKTKVLKENGGLMKVESSAECSPRSILQYFWPALGDNRYRKLIFGVLFEWPLKTGFTVVYRQYEYWSTGLKASMWLFACNQWVVMIWCKF